MNRRKLSLAFVSIATLMAGCSGAPGAPTDDLVASASPAAAVAPEPLSASEIFRGVYFGQGKAAERLPGFWGRPEAAVAKNLPPEQVRTIDELVARVAERDPSFFASFGVEMQSGDPTRIRSAFERGGQLIGEIVKAPGDRDPDLLLYFTWAIAAMHVAAGVNAVALLNAAAVVNFAVYATTYLWTNTTTYTSSSGGSGDPGGGGSGGGPAATPSTRTKTTRP